MADSASAVPSGWCAIRSDFAHFCKVHAAQGLRARLRMLCASRAFWGLALYRFGRWVYSLRRGPLTLPLRLVYVALFEIGRLITKTSLNVRSRIEDQVWIAPRGGSGAKVIGPLRIADGAAIRANSVVTADVPENGVVLGVPGMVISRRGSGDFIYLGEGTGVRDELPPATEVQVTLSAG